MSLDPYREDKARDALAFEPMPVFPWLRDEGGLVIATRYSERLSRLLGGLPGARWDTTAQCWRYPYTSADAIRRAAERIDQLQREAIAAADEETHARAARREAAASARRAQLADQDRQRAAARPRPLRAEYLRSCGPAEILTLEEIRSDLGSHQPAPPRQTVILLFGADGRGRFVGAYLWGRRDYSRANSVGSRGVVVHYELERGPIYRVSAPVSWRRDDRYWLRIDELGERRRMSREEVEACLEN